MSEPFLAEVKIVGFNFAPRNWAFCDGQILPINQNQSLYSLLGTTYGGDGRTSFGLPDLRGRAPLSPDSNNQGSKKWQRNEHADGRRNAVTHPYRAGQQRHTKCFYPGDQSAGQHRRWPAADRALRRRQFQHHSNDGYRKYRRPASEQYAAVSHVKFLYRAARHVPFTQLGRAPC